MCFLFLFFFMCHHESEMVCCGWGQCVQVLFYIISTMCVNGCVSRFLSIVKGHIHYLTLCIGSPQGLIRASMLFMHMLRDYRLVIVQKLETGWKLQYAIIHNCEQSFVLVLYVQHVCNVFYSIHSHCLFGDLEKCKKLVEVHCDRYAFILSIPLLWWQYIYIIRFLAYV